MNYLSAIKQRLKVMLMIVIVIAIGGALIAGVGGEWGIIAFIIGATACFPIVDELARTERAQKLLDRNDKI